MNGNDILGRKLPFSLEAEQSVIGSVLINPECFDDIAQIVSSEDFYLPEHEQIFYAMKGMYAQSKTVDVVTLADELVKEGVYQNTDTLNNYIRTIIQTVPSAANVVDYANIVHDKSMLRQLIEACSKITEDAYTEHDEVKNILDSAEQKIFDIASGNETKGFTHIREVLKTALDNLNLLATNSDDVHGLATGFSDLDNTLVGMGKGDLILVGARPGMGKTSFVLNIASNVAKQSKKAVCIFSLEMSNEELVSRMLSGEGMVDSYNIRSGKLTPEDWTNLAQASSSLAECDILIDDTTGLTVTGMRAKLRRVKNLGLVVIDYLQLMQSDRRNDNRVQEVAEISRNMKILAKELRVPVICCAQLSRGPESRTDKRPMLSDLRDSGAIEQDADVVMFLYRDEYYNTDKTAQSAAEIIVAKNRHGAVRNVDIGWLPQYTKFITLDKTLTEQP
ncbi:MAG: replicative DNA helicase [Ruminococcaceae bacterium]|nr:replicative DNA helicase [Oscillospiraceae bacterium]